VTTCYDLVRRLEAAGFHETALESAAGNGFIPGVTSVEDLSDPLHPCRGAIPRSHSHFFTSDGLFGSRDWNGEQVDGGTYELIGDNTVVMPYRLEDGPPIDVTFHYRIAGETIRFEPVLEDDCSTSRCREAAGWSVAVALAGKSWRRVGRASAAPPESVRIVGVDLSAVSSFKGSDEMYARVAPFESDPSRVDDAIRRALPTTNPIAARQLELNAIDPRLSGAGVRYVRVLYARAADATTRRAKNGSGEPSRRRDSNPRPPLYEGDLGPGTEDA